MAGSEAANTEKRVAVVTGGAQGIGKAIVQRFIAEGIRVAVLDIDGEALAEMESYLPAGSLCRHCDVADESSVREAVEETVSSMGRIDILVHNAGIMIRKPVESLEIDEWNRVIGTNLTGAFLCAKHCAAHLRKSKGSIINMCSTRGFMSEPHTESYSASKGGIFALTHSLAVSLGPDVRVNCISPGWIDVSSWQKESERYQEELRDSDHLQHPAGRVGKPEDIASIVFYLSSEETGFITGQNFTVDGGMTRKMIYLE